MLHYSILSRLGTEHLSHYCLKVSAYSPSTNGVQGTWMLHKVNTPIQLNGCGAKTINCRGEIWLPLQLIRSFYQVDGRRGG